MSPFAGTQRRVRRLNEYSRCNSRRKKSCKSEIKKGGPTVPFVIMSYPRRHRMIIIHQRPNNWNGSLISKLTRQKGTVVWTMEVLHSTSTVRTYQCFPQIWGLFPLQRSRLGSCGTAFLRQKRFPPSFHLQDSIEYYGKYME